MQAMTAENALTKSSPLASRTSVITTMVAMYIMTNAWIANTIWLGTAWAPILTGRRAAGCIWCSSSRTPWRNISTVRIIFSPPPVEPELAVTQLKSSIHIGAKIGQLLKSVLAKPQSVAIDTRLKLTWRSAVRNSG